VSLVVDEHREYLADRHRLDAFERAIAEVVRPGDIVLDLGAGTGILGLLACRAGAARVYAVEVSSLIGLTRAIARANACSDRIVHIKEHSTHATLPEHVDVVVCDQIGRFGFEAGVIENFADARRRFLKPDGRLVPAAVELWLAAVECPDAFAQVEFWNTRPAGVDVTPARAIAVNTGYPRHLQPGELLAPPACAGHVELSQDVPLPLRLAARLRVVRAGVLHGLGGWFAAALSPGVTMTNSPLAPDRVNRRNVFLPFDRPVEVSAGDLVDASLQALPEESVVVWQAEVSSPNAPDRPRARFTHSTWRGMLFDRDDLERTRPAHRPQLTPRGRARLSVLELADGRRTVAEIEGEVRRRHADLFQSDGEAATFVAEVLTRYAI
jgi:protein arginine N-methyltransferase 1